MDLADSAALASLTTLLLAGVARGMRAVDTAGAVAGCAVGVACSLGHGLGGLGVLGAFFVLGSAATKVGWARKSREGTAERAGGARGARRVLGKGGVAAALALGAVLGWSVEVAFVAAFAAALADTLATEVGTLSSGRPRMLPSLRAVDRGTPGAVSLLGTVGSIAGGALVAAAGWGVGLIDPVEAAWVVVAAAVATLAESLLTAHLGAFRARPGWLRNVATTGLGAAIAFVLHTSLAGEVA